jgi:hypothetical protein
LKSGNNGDQIDARKLAELLRAGLLSPVYHGEKSPAALQQLGRSYSALTEDTTRVMARLKAVYRSRAIPCSGKKSYGVHHRPDSISSIGAAARQEYCQNDGGAVMRRIREESGS